jgi:hypothetical protein
MLNWYDRSAVTTCPMCTPTPAINNYTFHPGLSDVQPYIVSGYWIAPVAANVYECHSFPAGLYTVVATDPWGQEAIGYFVSH